MGKRLMGRFSAAVLLLGVIPAARAEGPEIAAPSAVLMDAATGTVLFEKNAREALAPASVTKIMTLLLVMEALDGGRISWEDTVIASDAAAAKGGSQVYLEAGEQMSMDEMLKSVVVSSANDCATALAEHIAGSEAAFVEMMNARAAELGMANSHFVNCTGLDDEPNAAEHLTTAYDIALMSRELLKHEKIKEYTTIWMDTVRGGQFGLSNTNKLVRFYEGTTGLKTGYTSSAGHCLSATAQRDGIELIAVVMHCESSTDRFESAKALLNYGFANYALVQPQLQEENSVPVKLGTNDCVNAVPAEETQLLIDKQQRDSVTTQVQLEEQVSAPVSKGQRLGTLTVKAGDQVLAQVSMVAETAVPKLTLGNIFTMLLRKICMAR